MRSTGAVYLERLDHLRFYAAALVVCFHFFHRYVGELRPDNPLLSFIDEGHTGVGLFMVISGFVFTVITRDMPIDYWGFLRNRIIRIYPLYLFAVFLSLAISTYNQHMNYGFLQLVEWLVPYRASTVADSKYFVQLWTIWVEFQFYLIFPFLHQFLQRHGVRYLIGWLALLLLLRLMIFTITGSVRFIAYETIFGRLDQFLLGMLAAVLWLRRPNFGAHPLQLAGAALLVTVALHWFNRHGGYTNMEASYWIWWPLVEGLAWAWFLLAYLRIRWRLPARVESALAGLGAMSFSMYVMHNLALAFVDKLTGLPGLHADRIAAAALAGPLVALPVVVVFATFSYFLIERPFLRLRRNYLGRAAPA